MIRRALKVAALTVALSVVASAQSAFFVARQGPAVVSCAPIGTFNAGDPAASGYGVTFADNFSSLSTIDLTNAKTPGKKWYTGSFFSGYATPGAAFAINTAGADTYLTITSPVNNGNYNLATAMLNAAGDGYVGQGFGGSYYVESRLRFNPASINVANGWPSFWGLSLTHGLHNVSGGDQWAGQATGFLRWIETDFFEFALGYATDRAYAASFHDWYGDPTGTCAYGYRAGQAGICEITNAGAAAGSSYDTHVAGVLNGGNIDFAQWHTYGQLYVAASANGGNGYMQNFLDGQPAGAGPGNTSLAMVGWTNTVTPTPATLSGGPAAFGIVDQQPIYIILGVGQGQSMDVDQVRVWQIPGCTS